MHFCTQATVLALVQLILNQALCAFFCKAAFRLFSLQHVLMHGVIPSQVKKFAFPFVEIHDYLPIFPTCSGLFFFFYLFFFFFSVKNG